jgi:hypothetical protein
MPDTSSTQASFEVDLTAASYDIRERARTLLETANNNLRRIEGWPSLDQPDQKATLEQYLDELGMYCGEIEMTKSYLPVTGDLTAVYISQLAAG